MRTHALFIVLVLTVGQLSAAEPQTALEREVLAADLQRFDAMVKGDAKALDTLLAADAIVVNSNARVDDKQSILYAIRTKATAYNNIVATERKARVEGGVGIVSGVSAIRGVERKEAVDITVRYLAVYVKRDGRWQLTASHATQLIPTNTVISGQPA